MNLKEAEKRLQKLRHLIDEERYRIHVLNEENLSEAALDALKKELTDLETEFPQLITADSPSQRVAGGILDGFIKAPHLDDQSQPSPMHSLSDVFSFEELEAWEERLASFLEKQDKKPNTTYYVDPKMDGIALELIYEEGKLVQAITRGDGEVGEEITANAKTIESIPLTLRGTFPERVVVRGEAFFTKKAFEELNNAQQEKGEKLFANPRNATGGSLRQLDTNLVAERKLSFFCYGVVSKDNDQYPTHSKTLALLNSWGIPTNQKGVICNSLREVETYYQDLGKKRDTLPYEIDGVVIRLDSNTLYREAGYVGKGPRAAAAYKFPAEETTTKVEEIAIQVGRTGVLTPVAHLTPVPVGGVTVSRATLHNADEIERLGLMIGDTVIIQRSGDVIPKVIRVLTELRDGSETPFVMPKKCPADGGEVIKEEVMYRCSNPSCGARQREGLQHAVGRKALDLRGIGAKLLDKLIDEGLVTDLADLYLLQEGDLAAMERMGEKSAHNVVTEIAGKKEIKLHRFITALGILNVGEVTARTLATFLKEQNIQPKPTALGKYFQTTSLENIESLNDVGPIVAQSIKDWFGLPAHEALLQKLEEIGITLILPEAQASTELEGKTFVLTGTLSTMTRDEAKKMIREKGGTIVSSVSAKTSYVVAGEKAGSKLEKAQKLGVEVLDESGLEELLGK